MALQDRWNALCERIGAFKAAHESDVTFDMLRHLYSHPPRAYHDLAHIEQVLGAFDEVRRLTEQRDQVEFALWLHDCVYFAERPDNEERSADAAAMIAGLLGCPPGFAEGARALIMVTRHSIWPAPGDPAIVADVDLSVLAGSKDNYEAYRAAIRREFGFATDAQFIEGRSAFLRRMLDRDAIYATSYFKQSSERKARANLEQELSELEQGRL